MLRGGLAILVQLYSVLAIIGVTGMVWRNTLGLLLPLDILTAIHHLALGIFGGLALIALSRLCEHYFESVASLTRGFGDMLGSFSVRDSLVVALVSGIGEEVFFRGFLQGWIGIWWTSGLFALLHIGPDRRFVSWPILAFVASVVLGALLDHTGSVLAPIVAHALVNFVNLRHIHDSHELMDSESISQS
jgi:membrane protease YdiL (CAAX protease family)